MSKKRKTRQQKIKALNRRENTIQQNETKPAKLQVIHSETTDISIGLPKANLKTSQHDNSVLILQDLRTSLFASLVIGIVTILIRIVIVNASFV